MRQPKLVEVNTIPNVDPQGWDTSQNIIFVGTNDPLVISLTGWTVTPLIAARGNNQVTDPTNNGFATWDPTLPGVSLGLQNYLYGDIISAYIEGRMNNTAPGAAWVRTDPISYVDPYGRQYDYPVIMQWQPINSRPYQKQSFSLQLKVGNEGQVKGL